MYKSFQEVVFCRNSVGFRSLTVFFFGAIAAIGVAGASTLSIVGPDGVSSSTSTFIGEQIQIGVNIGSYSDLYAWQFDLSWNPAILSLNGITEGAVLAVAGPTFFVPGTIDNTGGGATASADTLLSAVSGVNGTSGTLAFFAFSTIGSGTTSLTLSNVTLLDSNLNDIADIPASGSVTVHGGVMSASPEPGTYFYVFVFALLALIFGRRHRRAFVR